MSNSESPSRNSVSDLESPFSVGRKRGDPAHQHPVTEFSSNPFLCEDIGETLNCFDVAESYPLKSQTKFIGRADVRASTRPGTTRESQGQRDQEGFSGSSGLAIGRSTKEDEYMDHRRQSAQGRNDRTVSDVERKKLEAELKAAEEIARIKQSVIEKRLAVELAALRDSQSMRPSQSPSDLRVFEEVAMRKQMMIQNNLARELDNIEYQGSGRKSGRASPPASSRSPAEILKASSFKREDFLNQSYANAKTSNEGRNPLARISAHCELRNPISPKLFSSDSATRHVQQTDSRYSNRYNERNVYPPPQPVVEPEYEDQRSSSAWKSAMSKIKKKLKKNKDQWE